MCPWAGCAGVGLSEVWPPCRLALAVLQPCCPCPLPKLGAWCEQGRAGGFSSSQCRPQGADSGVVGFTEGEVGITGAVRAKCPPGVGQQLLGPGTMVYSTPGGDRAGTSPVEIEGR